MGVFLDLSSPSVFIGDPWSLSKSFKNSGFPIKTLGNDSIRFVNIFKNGWTLSIEKNAYFFDDGEFKKSATVSILEIVQDKFYVSDFKMVMK